jgi:thiamine kinase-like enzyme
MDIYQLSKFTDPKLLDEMIQAWLNIEGPIVKSVSAKPAGFEFLNNGESNNALFLELQVELYPEFSGVVPAELVLKAGRNLAGTAEREMQFFQLQAGKDAIAGLVKCYGVRWLAAEDIGLLLLEKISGELISYHGPVEAHLPQYKNAVKVLASLHARWWNHPDLGSGEFAFQWTDEFLTEIMPLAISAYQDKIESSREQWLVAERKLFAMILPDLQALLLRHLAVGGPMCVGHGDAALWNFLLDEDETAPARLVDFQMWSVFPPAWDFAYMVVLLWPTDIRELYGEDMTDIYLRAIESNGISYSPAEFLEDLRISIVALVGLTLVNWQLGYWSEAESKERLRWVLAAFRYYDCARLFEPSPTEGDRKK